MDHHGLDPLGANFSKTMAISMRAPKIPEELVEALERALAMLDINKQDKPAPDPARPVHSPILGPCGAPTTPSVGHSPSLLLLMSPCLLRLSHPHPLQPRNCGSLAASSIHLLVLIF